jgi:hypothetical protein
MNLMAWMKKKWQDLWTLKDKVRDRWPVDSPDQIIAEVGIFGVRPPTGPAITYKVSKLEGVLVWPLYEQPGKCDILILVKNPPGSMTTWTEVYGGTVVQDSPAWVRLRELQKLLWGN